MTELRRPHLILVDDDDDLRSACEQGLGLADIEVEAFRHPCDALRRVAPDFCGVIVTDIRMPDMDGITLANKVRAIDPEIPIIFMTGHADVQLAVNTLKNGAFDFITKPFTVSDLVQAVRGAHAKRCAIIEGRWMRLLADDSGPHPVVGISVATVNLRQRIDRVSQAGMDVLVEGETGVGKELVARLLHRRNQSRSGALVRINCASLSEAKIDSILYGNPDLPSRSAAFARQGKIAEANRGTIILDNVDSMSSEVQAHFLQLLDDRSFSPGGSRHPESFDVVFVATSRTNLAELVAAGSFRDDLYYRVCANRIEVRPLRHRVDDILPLFAFFCGFAADEFDLPIPQMPTALREYLLAHDWPGNARELRHCAFNHVLGLRDGTNEPEVRKHQAILSSFEKSLLEEYLREAGGDISKVAANRGIPRKTLYDKFNRLGIEPGKYRG